MAFFLDEFRHLKIELEDIKSATDNFSNDNLIGKGGFGNVYKGEISLSNGPSMVAFKRLDLDSGSGQGNVEFWREIMMLSRYSHENIVSLLGYCNEGDEKIVVYEYASRGSLDRHLSANALTWMQRLKICLGVARGLNYLHDPNPMERQQRVLHCDIKSSNILLDENWNAKISDLGLSKIGPANQKHTFHFSNVTGTPGYIDPLYLEMGVLTKESDVYSLGVVLFEVLCSRLCFKYSNGQYHSLVRMWKKSYKQKKLDEIISRDLLQQMDVNSLETFSDIAYQCLKKTRGKRPLMVDVVGKLDIALTSQKIYEGVKLSEEYEEVKLSEEYEAIIKSAIPSLIFRSKAELQALLYKGIIVNGGKTWFSLNKNEEHCEMISSTEFIPLWKHHRHHRFTEDSRFPEVNLVALSGNFSAYVKPQFLSPGITYTVNLVFRITNRSRNSNAPTYLALNYKLKGETKYSTAYLAHEREDRWMTVELYQFTSHKRYFDLEILFDGAHIHLDSLVVEGIEFRPSDRVASEVEKVDIQPISDLDTDWEKGLPEDHEEIIKWSKDSIEWTTKKELYFLFCKGFLINNGEEWFFLAKNGKKCLFLPARALLDTSHWTFQTLPNLRFEEVALDCSRSYFTIRGEIKFQMLSPGTTYAYNLVYKITGDLDKIEEPVKVRNWNPPFSGPDGISYRYIYLLSPQSSVIGSNVDENSHNPPISQMPKIKGLPRLRNDGWMEVQIWEFETSIRVDKIEMYFTLEKESKRWFRGISVQGIEVKRERSSSL
ncbi:uncharacterized protein LOC112529041 [Cynara cardunculus var. scolymus]|uniref:uncharacterized protein LOC112529041 n=1 Tax=Cynara cardunculus var. scolymus TaxID=59895 RepID=UPI000D629E3A|nr:uncharacterized protein LOC112529041 [Cynara cardunculus var. scolymus]